MTTIFQNFFPNHPDKTILVPNQKISNYAQNLQLNKSEGVDFKYDKSFLKFQPKNTQVKHF